MVEASLAMSIPGNAGQTTVLERRLMGNRGLSVPLFVPLL
jgi:hypothetical protein